MVEPGPAALENTTSPARLHWWHNPWSQLPSQHWQWSVISPIATVDREMAAGEAMASGHTCHSVSRSSWAPHLDLTSAGPELWPLVAPGKKGQRLRVPVPPSGQLRGPRALWSTSLILAFKTDVKPHPSEGGWKDPKSAPKSASVSSWSLSWTRRAPVPSGPLHGSGSPSLPGNYTSQAPSRPLPSARPIRGPGGRLERGGGGRGVAWAWHGLQCGLGQLQARPVLPQPCGPQVARR